MNLFVQNVIENTLSLLAVGLLTGIFWWLVKSYRQFKEMNTLLGKALGRLDKHEQRLDDHDRLLGYRNVRDGE